MKKNVGSQSIGVEMITAADGTAFTGTVTVVITIDNGTQSSSGGTAPAHEGNGYHSYTPTQAETNGDHLAFTFTGSGAIPATVQVFTMFPQTVDNNVLAAGTTGFTAIDTVVDAILVDTSSLNDTKIPQTLNLTASGNIGIDWANVENPTTALDLSGTDIQLVDTATTVTGGATAASIAALNDVAATDIVSSGAITTSAGAVSTVTTVGTTTTNTDMRGTDSALLAASINLTAGAVDNVTTVATTTTNTDMVAEPTTLLTTQMTEAYAADGTAPTLAQALFLIQQTIGDFAIAGTTITTKKLDGSTTAATYTLDDGTSPTSRTRAS